jgi:hypothetical protein
MGRDHAVWDVHTDKSRWWVITNPTNLYSQTLMPSLDYTLSFHIGLMARVAAANRPPGTEAEQAFIPTTTRHLVEVSDAYDAADESTDFQAVGMRCRELLLTLVRELVEHGKITTPEIMPKIGDFVGWSNLIADHVSGGGSAEFARGYLKQVADRGWRLVNWLTHARNAKRDDARLAMIATSHIVDAFASEALRSTVQPPPICMACGSRRIATDWRPELGKSGEYVARCEACGAEARKIKTTPTRKRRNSGKPVNLKKKSRVTTKR